MNGDFKFTRWSFALVVFPICKQITLSNLFSTAFNLVGDLFVLPHLLHVIEFN